MKLKQDRLTRFKTENCSCLDARGGSSFRFLVNGVVLLFTLIFMSINVSAAGYDSGLADSITVLIDDESEQANGQLLTTLDSTEDRIPLILIHGIHGIDNISTPSRSYWTNFLSYFYAHGELNSAYKIYLFNYESDKYSVKEIAKSLRNHLDDAIVDGQIRDVPFVVLAHSMGGLVARSYMNEYSHLTTGSSYENKKGGERVLRLITLATPHHGTPAANDTARTFLLGGQAELTAMTNLIDIFYWWKMDANCADAIVDACGSSNLLEAFINLHNVSQDCQILVDEPNRSDLRYDNYYGISAEYNKITESNDWLKALNETSQFSNKIIAYYGALDSSDPLYYYLYSLTPLELLSVFARSFPNKVIPAAYNPYSYDIALDEHKKLLFAGALMTKFYAISNDGMLPMDSGQFFRASISKKVFMDGYDHLDMKDGALVLDQINTDLLDILDLTAPAISISSPTDATTQSGHITVTVAASDNVNVSNVKLYLDNTLKFTDSSAPYSWDWDTTTYSNGSYDLTAKAYDLAGNIGESPVVSITVNNSSGTGNNSPALPTFFGQFKSNGSTGLGFGGITDERIIVLQGDVSDPDGDPIHLVVEVKPVGTSFNNVPYSNCSSGAPVNSGGTATVTCSGLVDGQYHWQAMTRDDQGAEGSWASAGGNLESEADFIVSAGSASINQPPSVTIISPNGGEWLIADNSYEIKWIASDDQQLTVGLLYSTDSGATWTGIPGATALPNSGSFQWTAPGIITETARISVMAMDGELITSDWSDSNFSIVNNCDVPTIPTMQNISSNGNSFTVAWTSEGNTTHYNLQQDNSSLFGSPAVVYTSNGTSWYSGVQLPDTYYYRVKAINSCGESDWSNIVNVTILADQGPDEINAFSPVDNSTNQLLDVTLSWSAGHSGGENLKYNVYVSYSDTTNFYINNIKSYGQTDTTYSLSNLPYNTVISWGIEAIDATGDIRFSDMFHFTTIADNSAPTGSVLINNGDSSTTSCSVTLSLSASDGNSGVKSMRFSNDGSNWVYWVQYSQQYGWNLAELNYGGQNNLSTYTVYAQFKDYEGNESQVYSATITKSAGTPGQILLNGQTYDVIQDAIDAAAQGDSVYLTEGMYQFKGSVIPTNYTNRTVGIQMKPGVTLMGAGAQNTIIDVSGYAFSTIVDADNSIIEGLTIINSGNLMWRYVVLLESDSSKIKNCIVKGGDTGIYIGWDSTHSASNSEITNNLIINNRTNSINLNSGSNISIYNNTIANNNGYGFIGLGPSGRLVNNIIANNGSGGSCGVYSFNSFASFQRNNVVNNYTNYCNVPDQTGISGNISSNPYFVNPASENYHLNAGSPAINSGTNVGIPYGGNSPDIGAYEYNGTGIIQVTSNRTDASFSLKGPSGTYDGSGTNWSMSNMPIGIYNVTFSPITNLYTPPYQMTMMYSGQVLTFDGTYEADTFGPTGTIVVNFEEYATPDNLVSITFDIVDEMAGIGNGSQMMFSNDGVTWSTAESYSAIKKGWDLTLYGGNTVSGTKTVYARVSDLFGNWSTLIDTITYVPDRRRFEVPTQYSTIQNAIDAAQDGDMVYVHPGEYGECVKLKAGVILQGSGLENTVLDCSSVNDVDASIVIMEDRTIIDGFTIGNSNNILGKVGLSCSASSIISNNKIFCRTAISNGNGEGRLIVRNNIINAYSWGIILGNNCDSCPDLSVSIENNTIKTNKLSYGRGVYLMGGPYFRSKITIKNNIFVNNAEAIVDSHNDTIRQHIFTSFNIYWNNIKNLSGNISEMGLGDISEDPLFIDPGNGNYHIQTVSPGVNSGDPEKRYNDPNGTRNDRGTYGGPTLNSPPIANFSINPSQASTGVIITFDAGLSHDREVEDEQLQARWDVNGDGTYDTVFSTNKVFAYQYILPGEYDVVMQVKDNKGFISSITKPVSIINRSPLVPEALDPQDGTINQPVELVLRWSGGDYDLEDVVYYDVYFGTTINPPLVSSEQHETFYRPEVLSPHTVFYWKIVAKDSFGDTSISPLRYFVTGAGESVAFPVIGDINGDSIVNMEDLILALQILSGFGENKIRFNYSDSGADVNGDGKVGLEEAIFIEQILAR